jgi:hypothetical protein
MAKSITTGAADSPYDIKKVFRSLQMALADSCLSSPGLAIGSSSKAKPKIVNTFYALIDGVLVKKTTAEITLTTANNVANAKFNVIVLTMNASGTVTPRNGTAGDTIGAVVFPTVPSGEVVIGFVIVNPTGTGGFVGGTTEFDDATVVPNAVYVNTDYAFNPNILTLPSTII